VGGCDTGVMGKVQCEDWAREWGVGVRWSEDKGEGVWLRKVMMIAVCCKHAL
jgi:hypothetical protein